MKKYKVILSTKTEILIDEDEIDLVVQGIKAGAIVKVRQGIFNPAYFTAIILAKEEMQKWKEDKKYEIREGKLPPLPPVLEDMFQSTVKKLTSKN